MRCEMFLFAKILATRPGFQIYEKQGINFFGLNLFECDTYVS